MPKVTGPLKTVLSNPSQVIGAWIRSGGDRPDGDGVVLNELDEVPITGGAVSFTAVPGPAVLVLQRAGDRPTNLKIMVGTSDSSLADAVKAANVANHLDSYRLSQLVGMIETTQENAADAAAAADRAEAALRLDTTVGTRVFAGDTMIYGDTGWRNIAEDLLSGDGQGWNVIRRIGNVVYMTVQLSNVDLPGLGRLYDFPQGFSTAAGGRFRNFSADMSGTTWLVRPGYLSAQEGKKGQTWMSLSFPTNDSWPTTLPGLPA